VTAIIRELPPFQLLDGVYQWILTTLYQRIRTSLDPGNTQHINIIIESAARGFRVLPSTDSTFLATTSRGAGYIVHLPPEVTQLESLLQATCSGGKYQGHSAACSHAIACILLLAIL
jgi:hypothetical protein